MKSAIRMFLLLLTITGVAACHITFGSVDLDRIESPRDWTPGTSGGRPVDR